MTFIHDLWTCNCFKMSPSVSPDLFKSISDQCWATWLSHCRVCGPAKSPAALNHSHSQEVQIKFTRLSVITYMDGRRQELLQELCGVYCRETFLPLGGDKTAALMCLRSSTVLRSTRWHSHSSHIFYLLLVGMFVLYARQNIQNNITLSLFQRFVLAVITNRQYLASHWELWWRRKVWSVTSRKRKVWTSHPVLLNLLFW